MSWRQKDKIEFVLRSRGNGELTQETRKVTVRRQNDPRLRVTVGKHVRGCKQTSTVSLERRVKTFEVITKRDRFVAILVNARRHRRLQRLLPSCVSPEQSEHSSVCPKATKHPQRRPPPLNLLIQRGKKCRVTTPALQEFSASSSSPYSCAVRPPQLLNAQCEWPEA